MADIALGATNDYLTGMPSFDIVLTEIPDGIETIARDVEMDEGLSTAVYISLFTDARDDSVNGWWGDAFDSFGSLLWQLVRGKATDEALNLAETTTRDCLKWLVDDGVAESVQVSVLRIGLNAISISVVIRKPDQTNASFRYALNWAAMG